MNERLVRFIVAHPGGRLDHVLVEQIPELSRSRLQQLIRKGLVSVDGEEVTKTGARLDGGESVEVRIPPVQVPDMSPEPMPLDVVFENEDVLVVNKPAGIVVHPSPGHDRGTLVHGILAHAPDILGVGGVLRPGVVHRLDKDTSGLVIMAKHDEAHRMLQRQFKAREVEKVYLALVDGEPPTQTGRVEAPIGRDPRRRKRMGVVHITRGREAHTVYRVVERFKEYSFLEVRPQTGRTHQIRVHMAFLGCPVVGDKVYGRRKPTLAIGRQFLHAQRLDLVLPGETEKRSFVAPLPDDLEQVLSALRDREAHG